MFMRLAICERSETNCQSRTVPIAKRIRGMMKKWKKEEILIEII